MGLFDIFRSGAEVAPDRASRRKFLRQLATAAPAAVAAAAAIDLKFIPELQAAAADELFKLDQMVEGDIGLAEGKIFVSAPQHVFDTARVWRSVANEAGAWADYLSGQTGVTRDSLLVACTRLARAVDMDLRHAQIDSEAKIDVQLPHVTRAWTNHRGEKQCEIGLGLHKEKLFDGTEQFQVKFKQEAPRVVDAQGKVFDAVR